jgi:hypothetical protein
MKEEIKRARDRSRFEKYGGMELVKELIMELPEKESYSRGHVFETAMLIAKRKIRRKTKQKYFLAETIIRQAVGNGYLHPQGKRYLLTKKSRKLKKKFSKNSNQSTATER